MPEPINRSAVLAAIARQWGVNVVRWRNDLSVSGSPERTSWRCVAETGDGRLYVVEKIASRVYGRKRRIVHTLQQLAEQGLPGMVTYLPDRDGETIPLIDHGLWQLSPFVAGVDLDRPVYTRDAWRGEAAATFLVRLHDIGTRCHWQPPWPPFFIPDYIRNLSTTLASRDPDTARCFAPFRKHLDAHLFPIIPDLPVQLCHGDFHPLNIIWGHQAIRAVIDWEFCGVKPELYDLANLLGCLGMEDPRSLSGPFAGRLVDMLKSAGRFADASWRALPDMMLAIRFAWLSEWMRKNDRTMVQMEADYMALLIELGPSLGCLCADG